MAVAVAVTLDECGAMIAALVSRCREAATPRAAGALAALSWIAGLTDRRPVSRDLVPATAGTIGDELDLAGRIAGGTVGSTIPGEYAAGAVDAALWALGRTPRQPLT